MYGLFIRIVLKLSMFVHFRCWYTWLTAMKAILPLQLCLYIKKDTKLHYDSRHLQFLNTGINFCDMGYVDINSCVIH